MPRPATSRSSACPHMRYRASARKPLPRAATSSKPNRSSSSFWSPPFGASLRTRNNSPPCWSGWRAAWQAHLKHRTFARLARHGHVASHHARELAGDGKAEPRAAEALRGRGVSLAELLEQPCLLLGSHANASVSDGELNPAASVGDPTRLQLDLTLFGELAGIAQQVEQYLPQPHGVHGEDTQVLLGVNDEAALVLLGKLTRGVDHVVDQGRELHGLRIEFELSSLDLRQVENLVDEAKKVSTSAVHALQRLLRLFCAEARRIGNQHVSEPNDGIERRAQL